MLNVNWEFFYSFSEWGSLFGILLLIILSAFFSGSETALTASSRAKLRSMTDRASPARGLSATCIRETNSNILKRKRMRVHTHAEGSNKDAAFTTDNKVVI